MAENQPTGANEVVTKDHIKLPLWMWIVVGGIVLGGTVYVYKMRKANAAQQAAAAAQQQTPTTPMPTPGAYVDPTTILPIFQGQAVPNMAPPSTPAGPQLPQVDTQVDPSKIVGNRWDVILPTENYLSQFIERVYGTPENDAANLAINDSYVRQANPQIDFNRPLTPGQAIFAPGIPK